MIRPEVIRKWLNQRGGFIAVLESPQKYDFDQLRTMESPLTAQYPPPGYLFVSFFRQTVCFLLHFKVFHKYALCVKRLLFIRV